MEAEAAARAAWEKAHAEMPERFDRMAVDELLRACASVYRHYGWTVKPATSAKVEWTLQSALLTAEQ